MRGTKSRFLWRNLLSCLICFAAGFAGFGGVNVAQAKAAEARKNGRAEARGCLASEARDFGQRDFRCVQVLVANARFSDPPETYRVEDPYGERCGVHRVWPSVIPDLDDRLVISPSAEKRFDSIDGYKTWLSGQLDAHPLPWKREILLSKLMPDVSSWPKRLLSFDLPVATGGPASPEQRRFDATRLGRQALDGMILGLDFQETPASAVQFASGEPAGRSVMVGSSQVDAVFEDLPEGQFVRYAPRKQLWAQGALLDIFINSSKIVQETAGEKFSKELAGARQYAPLIVLLQAEASDPQARRPFFALVIVRPGSAGSFVIEIQNAYGADRSFENSCILRGDIVGGIQK